MKWFLPLLIILIMFSGCTTLPNQKDASLDEIRTALQDVVETASERIEANMHSQMKLIAMIPPSSSSLLDQGQIPLLEEHLQMWSKQVLAAFRQATIAMPQLLKPYIEQLEIADPVAIMKKSDSSSSALLLEKFRPEIENGVRLLLEEQLSASQETWDMLTDRYAIWSRSKALLGEEALPLLGGDPTDHLIRAFLSAYLTQLTREELHLRTTPVFQGTGSFYEILNKRAQQ